MDVGAAAESADSESSSTPAVNFAELPQSFNWVEESTHDHGIFSPTTRERRSLGGAPTNSPVLARFEATY